MHLLDSMFNCGHLGDSRSGIPAVGGHGDTVLEQDLLGVFRHSLIAELEVQLHGTRKCGAW